MGRSCGRILTMMVFIVIPGMIFEIGKKRINLLVVMPQINTVLTINKETVIQLLMRKYLDMMKEKSKEIFTWWREKT